MKVNKLFSLLMAGVLAVGLSGCKGGDDPKDPTPTPTDEVTITPERHEFKKGETVTLTCSAAATWKVISNSNSVTLNVEEGVSAVKVVATAVKGGNATVIATVGTEQAYATLVVKEDQTAGKTIEASEIYPIILDAVTFEANKAKVVADFRVDDTNNFLYIWSSGETYNEGDGTSTKNFFGNNEGFISLTVSNAGWSGGGFCLTNNAGGSDIAGLNALIDKMIANPDDYYLHLGLKSTDNVTQFFDMLGIDGCEFAVGKGTYDVQNSSGQTVRTIPCFTDIPRTGAWGEVIVPMSKFTSILKHVEAGVNIFAFHSGGIQGTQLNMDACYFYKK